MRPTDTVYRLTMLKMARRHRRLTKPMRFIVLLFTSFPS